MPANHRWYLDWTPQRFTRWAQQIGPNTETLIAAVLASRRHPEQGYRTCLGILKLGDQSGKMFWKRPVNWRSIAGFTATGPSNV